jgi:hypothetical protein
MSLLRSLALCLLLQPIALCHAEQALPEPSPASTPTAPIAAAEALGLAMAEAVESSTDCASMGKNLDAALASQSAALKTLAASNASDSGVVSEKNQKRLLAMAQKAKTCAGKLSSPALAALESALSTKIKNCRGSKGLVPSGAKADLKMTPRPTQLMSEQSCKDDCCIKGWQTWATVAFYTTACLGGSNQACCLATTIASYDACVNTYCPTNNCCQDVPVSVPPPAQ